MFVGHGMVAFALVASAASLRGWSADRVVLVGIVAALFGTLPDVDMVYAVVGVLGRTEGVFPGAETFWATAQVVHRSVTHSLVIGVVAGAGFAAWDQPRYRPAALVAFGVLGAVVGIAAGPVAIAVLGVFLAAGIGIVGLARTTGFGSRTILAAALVGLLTHPFGDLLTGTPPAMLFPAEWTVLTQRITLHPDPTVHLLGAFFVELATIWVALFVLARVRGWQLWPAVRPHAGLGVGYAGAVFAIPAPTLEFSWPFVLTVLGVGLVGVPVGLRDDTGERMHMLVTALTAVTVAALAYAGAYLVVG